MLKQYLEQHNTENGQARLAAIMGTVELTNLIPPTVSYESRGNLVIIGPNAIIVELAPLFSEQLNSVTLVCTDLNSPVESKSDTELPGSIYYASQVEVKGFLGAFEVSCQLETNRVNLSQVAIGINSFDIVLDMTQKGLMTEEVPVPGYYPVGRGYPKLAEVLEEIPGLKGTFDKPKYFRLDSDLCAHSSRGVKGCERCVDACPAGALSSVGSEQAGHQIQINPYLCQGVGTCATSCPTEAISYALPDAQNTQNFIQRVLAKYEQHGGKQPIVMFCSERHESFNVMALKTMPENVLPIVLDELPSVGMDTWFAALVNGASQVLFLASRRMPATIQRVLGQEVEVARSFLSDLGLEENRIQIAHIEALEEVVLIEKPLVRKATPLEGNKRQRLLSALDHLSSHYLPDNVIAQVPAGAPFGSVECASQDCTLCMSCVAVCPTRALHTKGDSPGLLFIEQDCVQCGLCEKACPENVLTLKPQMNWDSESRQNAVVVHEEEAACCISCGTAFAPASMIKMLTEKLQGNPHFNDESSLRRLSMCEDCRVRDIFTDLSAHPEKQLNV